MIAKAEIDGEHGGRIIAGLEAFLGARAAELEAEVEKHRAEEGEPMSVASALRIQRAINARRAERDPGRSRSRSPRISCAAASRLSREFSIGGGRCSAPSRGP